MATVTNTASNPKRVVSMQVNPRKLIIRSFFVLALCLFSMRVGSAQPGQPESLLLSPGDLIHVSVFGVPDMDQHVRITDAGQVTIPLIGTISVAGLNPAAAAQRISDALAKGDFIRHAQVSILVEQFAKAEISVTGQVQHPGNFAVTTPRNLMDVLSMAGGMTSVADIHITVKRRNGQSEIVDVTLPNDAATALGNAILVYPGDLVIVPRAGIVYVLGDVAKPGGYVMTNDGQLTVMQAIALASGTTKTAAEGQARLLRQTAAGPLEISLRLKAMEHGSEADLLLQPMDVIYIPYSTAKNIMLGASSILSSAGGAAIYAAK